MIVFDLKCRRGHCFEGWFEGGDSFEQQKEKGLISCPVCDDTDICRVPSTFGIKSSQPARDYPEQKDEMAMLGNRLKKFVEKNFDDVGAEFAKEALKIHYGASEPRNIRGVSTNEEEKVLEKEGVKFLKIPIPQSPDTDA